jgi:hypothetical protein
MPARILETDYLVVGCGAAARRITLQSIRTSAAKDPA